MVWYGMVWYGMVWYGMAAVIVIADCTVYDGQYSYRLLAEIAVVSMNIYLFTVSH